MKRRVLSLLLVVAMFVGLMPLATAADQSLTEEIRTTEEIGLTEQAYEKVDALWEEIDAMEAAPEKKNCSQTEITDAVSKLVRDSEGYVKDSLERNGNTLTWWTEDGIHCIYDPYMQAKDREMKPGDAPVEQAAAKAPAVKGGMPSSKEVFLIGPYYGVDSNFTDYYAGKAQQIANAIGDTDGYTLYSGSAATVDAVAYAVSTGAVVLVDSHGSTDYSNGDDFVSGATNSYICLTTSSGVTYDDYLDGAMYGNGYAYVNGETISNHMTTNSPAGIVWMGICLGMATDALCVPLRNRGVEVVYGYSQSVTFGGDICWNGAFWDSMMNGNPVADAVAYMKDVFGEWDCSQEICDYCGWYGSAITNIYDARANYMAFPIVVSGEDAYPGKGNVDNLQVVNSGYSLFGGEVCSHANTHTETSAPTCTEDGHTYVICDDCGRLVSSTVIPATGHNYSGGYCTNCGAEEDRAFYLVQSEYDLTDGEYVLLTEALGSYSSAKYYGVLNYMDDNYSALQTVPTGFSSPPESITATDGFVWNITVTGNAFTLRNPQGQYLCDTSDGSGVSVGWSSSPYYWYLTGFYYDYTIGLQSQAGGYLSMRDDLSATGSNGEPVVAVSSGITVGGNDGSPYFFLYRRAASGHAAVCPSARFRDVNENDWFHEAVDFAIANGLFNGMSDTTFEPNTPMTRAMLVTVLWRYAGQHMEGSNTFSDVPNGQWYTDAVAWAAYNNIVGGVGNNRFNPNGNVTREQMATILYRYAASIGIDTSARADISGYPDARNVSSYATDAMRWAVAMGLINGSEGKLLPQGNATRAQVATILMRFIQNVVTQ